VKRFIALFLLVACAAAGTSAPAPGAARRLERVKIQGRDYVRLADWARVNDLQWRWTEAEKSLQASNRAAKLSLAVDSCEAKINGVSVSLLFPVAYRDRNAYVSQLDVDSTFQPLLAPPKNRAGAIIKTICLDPGHGGRDPGERVGAREEKECTLMLAFELREQLKQAGFKVSLTRASDKFVELPDRAAVARRAGADLFVSLHFNATETGRNEVKGSEVYCLTPAGAPSTNSRGGGAGSASSAGNRFNEKNLLLAWQIQKSIVGDMSVDDRGV
jgi:N-acetylmuramoyl-L-alanine amidase